MKYKIAVIPGDGIGREVVDEGVKLLKLISKIYGDIDFTLEYFDYGCDYYVKHGVMMEEDGLEKLSQFDAIYLGAVGNNIVSDDISLRGLLLKIRQGFDQYVNLRPIKLLKGVDSIVKNKSQNEINMIFVRENSEGEYIGTGSHMFKGSDRELVIQDSVFTRYGCERIIRYAFEIAKNSNKTLTSISKANALNYSMVFWDNIFNELKEEYPEVETHSYLVDAATIVMLENPEKLEVVVSSNLFGDILTDLGAAIAGGIGLAAGANINPERKYPSMFEPIHGSAPDIAGDNIANPIAAIWSVSQMMDFFGREDIGADILKAIEYLIEEGTHLPRDMGGNAKTGEVGDRLCYHLKNIVKM
ncbi:tartrate dehydrogenase [Anaerosphaera multitolerans]|uniref:D-malate dehydrogenase (decarboxylating) n=1 Tax=Anaerosphaera multitolerans TaxID=2487351 RepID=A0A437S848_9FIRM|nr:tartrate dehydrogenase [Anaerosphaera multitolerans]RVU55256.1 tartrate dehydrogenase [Anaerosphaera multitolerans]